MLETIILLESRVLTLSIREEGLVLDTEIFLHLECFIMELVIYVVSVKQRYVD